MKEIPCPAHGSPSSTRPSGTASRPPAFRCESTRSCKMARQLDALGVDIIEAGFPIASEADAEAVRMIATHVRGPVIAALARCRRRHRTRRLGARTGAAATHPHVHRDLRPAPRAQAAHDARGVPARRDARRPAARGSTPTTWSFRPRTRRAATPTSSAASSRRSSSPAPRRSTCPTRSATRRRTRSPSSSRPSSTACRTRTRRSSARTATTTSGWRSRTRSPRSAAAPGRSSARSTASASAPATRRSKRS